MEYENEYAHDGKQLKKWLKAKGKTQIGFEKEIGAPKGSVVANCGREVFTASFAEIIKHYNLNDLTTIYSTEWLNKQIMRLYGNGSVRRDSEIAVATKESNANLSDFRSGKKVPSRSFIHRFAKVYKKQLAEEVYTKEYVHGLERKIIELREELEMYKGVRKAGMKRVA